MIVSASYRTDIPAFYGAWFLARVRAGFALVANPYNGSTSRISLLPADVGGLVLWTKNAAPFSAGFDALDAAGLPFVVQYTVTGLPRALERSAPPPEAAVADIRRLSGRFGKRAVVWRYDPMVISEATPPGERLATFARLAAALAGSVDEVVLSFLQPYAKTRRNLAETAWRDPPADTKGSLLATLAGISQSHGIKPTLCAQPDLVDRAGGLEPAQCIDAVRLSDVAGRRIEARIKGNRPGCLCAESRDIGRYDTCPMGCSYCYAVRDRARALQALADHDPAAEKL